MSETIVGTPRNVAELLASIEAGQKPEFLFFTEHRSVSRGPLGPGCLSQWWPSSFSIDDVVYFTALHYMMARKARLFGDETAESKIVAAPAPKAAFTLGRQIKGFNRTAWADKREQVVFEGNLAKFSQDPQLGSALLATGDRILVFANPTDVNWGTGVDALDLRSPYPERWRGLNLLGFALMAVRSQLADKSLDHS